jgi:Domain of unknown function (DUF4440)
MRQRARTPEELEALLEDAFVIRDREALAALFEDGAVLGDESQEARGADEIARAARDMWQRDRTYVAEPSRVVQARDTVLIVAGGGTHVVRRGGDGNWRYVIALLAGDHAERRIDHAADK